MEGMRNIVLLILCFVGIIATVMPVASGIIDQSPEGVENWFDQVCFKEEKKTKLHFYFHDQVSGANPTAVLVAQTNKTANSSTLFGSVYMLDEKLTVGPEPNSTEVGRAQGISVASDMKEIGLTMTLNLVFTSKEYNGSTLSLLGRNPISHKYREMPIIGGTGVFRLARGIATVKTYSVDPILFDVIVEFNVIVIHY